jgi:hypothetical protein
MKWASRIISFVSGGLFVYWTGMGSSSPDWWLWGKFMVVSVLSYEAGQLMKEARLKNG